MSFQEVLPIVKDGQLALVSETGDVSSIPCAPGLTIKKVIMYGPNRCLIVSAASGVTRFSDFPLKDPSQLGDSVLEISTPIDHEKVFPIWRKNTACVVYFLTLEGKLFKNILLAHQYNSTAVNIPEIGSVGLVVELCNDVYVVVEHKHHSQLVALSTSNEVASKKLDGLCIPYTNIHSLFFRGYFLVVNTKSGKLGYWGQTLVDITICRGWETVDGQAHHQLFSSAQALPPIILSTFAHGWIGVTRNSNVLTIITNDAEHPRAVIFLEMPQKIISLSVLPGRCHVPAEACWFIIRANDQQLYYCSFSLENLCIQADRMEREKKDGEHEIIHQFQGTVLAL